MKTQYWKNKAHIRGTRHEMTITEDDNDDDYDNQPALTNFIW